MIEILANLVLYVSLYFGVFLAVRTCEELHAGEKYFILLRQSMFFLSVLLGLFLIFGFSLYAFAGLIIIGILVLVLRKFKFFESVMFFLLMGLSLVVILSGLNVLKSIFFSLVFFYGVFQGTLDAKELLFKKHNYKKFTTQTKFKLEEQIGLYGFVFKKYIFSLIITVLGLLFFIVKMRWI